MLKPIVTVLAMSAISVSVLAAGQQPAPKVKIVPLKPTSSASGKQMYMNYCASCHGPDGKGAGPAAPALKQKPADLTGLAKANGGKFPERHVSAILQFGVPASEHGSKEMPVWGATFSESRTSFSETPGEVQLRLENLVRYLQSIQQ